MYIYYVKKIILYKEKHTTRKHTHSSVDIHCVHICEHICVISTQIKNISNFPEVTLFPSQSLSPHPITLILTSNITG